LKQHLKEEQIYRWGILDEFTWISMSTTMISVCKLLR
jgi:hypothetical protein